ncbi:hypothetical protein [Treponema pectinovorum]|uniref:hypothetical protein n=1 Tax=Treponema pectinovorum TaxID=164 RepID=UPI0011F22539|nr:hypothetical protein [Treponema pectinovorum]
MKKSFLIFAVFVFSFFSIVNFISCEKRNDLPVFDSRNPLSVEPGVEWVLITSPYAACYRLPNYEAEVTNHLRRGEIRMIEGMSSTKMEDSYEKWIFIEEGWIPENLTQIFSNRLKAEKALKDFDL